jgi:splicing factor 3B subunit 5
MPSEVTGRGDPFVLPGKPCAPHIENLILRQEGTGTYHTTPEAWLQDQYRDTLSSLAQRYDLLTLTSLAHNNVNARTRRELLEKMVDPLQLREDPRYLKEQYGSALPPLVHPNAGPSSAQLVAELSSEAAAAGSSVGSIGEKRVRAE